MAPENIRKSIDLIRDLTETATAIVDVISDADFIGLVASETERKAVIMAYRGREWTFSGSSLQRRVRPVVSGTLPNADGLAAAMDNYLAANP